MHWFKNWMNIIFHQSLVSYDFKYDIYPCLYLLILCLICFFMIWLLGVMKQTSVKNFSEIKYFDRSCMSLMTRKMKLTSQQILYMYSTTVSHLVLCTDKEGL